MPAFSHRQIVFMVIGAVMIAAGSYGLAWWSFHSAKMAPQDTGQALTAGQDEAPKAAAAPPPSPTFTTPVPDRTLPRYIRNAAHLPPPAPGTPRIAIIIDDMGVVEGLTREAVNRLPAAMTFAFLPYGKSTGALAREARARGHEIMIHLPMEPMSHGEEPPHDAGPNALFVTDDSATLAAKTHANMEELLDVAVGVNNHMGSRFTAWEAGMSEVLGIVAAEKLLFVDSITTADSKVPAAAALIAERGIDLPMLRRDVFIDHYMEDDKVTEALAKLEAHAAKTGYAIGIGHPHEVTISALAAWAPTLEAKGMALVPISALVGAADAE